MPTPDFSIENVNQGKTNHLEVSEIVLQEFGYPKRAKYLVEYIESQVKDEGMNCYVEYIIGFSVRRPYWVLEDVVRVTDSGDSYKTTERVLMYHKDIKRRRFKSLKQLLD